jgi:hypothetical protein
MMATAVRAVGGHTRRSRFGLPLGSANGFTLSMIAWPDNSRTNRR